MARRCGDVLNDIVTNVASVSNMSAEISNASQEQGQGISEINKAMAQLDQVTQQNATSTGQTANSAEQLSVQAESLRAAVDELMKTINGSAESPSARLSGPRGRKPSRPASNVIAMPIRKKAAPQRGSDDLKKASGDSFGVPRSTDPGFES